MKIFYVYEVSCYEVAANDEDDALEKFKFSPTGREAWLNSDIQSVEDSGLECEDEDNEHETKSPD